MHIIWMIIIGGVVGALAKLIMPGKDPGGIIITILLGIAGAIVAGFIGRAIGWYDEPGQGPGLIASVIGAIIVLAGYRLIAGERVT
ncbi:MAG TPA: GlsB/YeaQ/YmgE family stress response membrane protein [Kofleriaceae bacterium]|nr:GlsB/YeaQ/YmgE family stress response membrane protein [Kofleriaceae bacterium]